MKKKAFQIAQGDLLIRSITTLPSNLTEGSAHDGAFVVAHSETGHHHIVDAHPGVRYFNDPKNQLVAYLTVERDATTLRHLRQWDTHAPHTLPPGRYELRRQREWTPEAWQRVAD